MKCKTRLLSCLLVCSIVFCSLPFNAYADEFFEVPAPTIEISTNKSNYRTFDVAEIKVRVYATAEAPIENVNIETSLDKQLSCTSASSISKETALLTDEPIEYSFGVVVAKNAAGLNIFQRLIVFFKSLLTRTYSVKGKSYNDGRTKKSESCKITLGSVSGTITVDVWYQGTIQNTDTDGDGLIDYIERVNGLNPNLADTDSDGLNDFDEFVIVGTDPAKVDTDGNGINDYDDDNDQDGLSNGYELSIGTSANSSDTDCDGLDDKVEVEKYRTDPAKEDTDEDGATDGWEAENGFDPTRYNNTFKVTVECESGSITASATVNTNGNTAESITVTPVNNNPLIDETIPGYLGSAFEFESEGDLGITKITFTFDQSLQNNPDFNPTVYCLNEETQSWYEYETIISGNSATAQSTHFSTYILINKNVYERYCKEHYLVDYSLDAGVDSNNDGISDYITKLMCDGIIRTGTGTMIFGNYTYEQIQSSSDIDGDGIKNGDEITVNYQLTVPEDATEYDGHYYKRFDVGYVWDDAEAYCESIGGYLATITSAAEQNVVQSIVQSGHMNSYWLGARKKDKVYHWVSGEQFGYTNWAPGEPNDYTASGYEDCLMMYNAKNPMVYYNAIGQWNDLNNQAICGDEEFFGIEDFGFVCEWGTYSIGNHSYTFVNSSPIHKDTDNDGFADVVDPSPFVADVFATITDYKKYYYDDAITVTVFARQPKWGSRCCKIFDSEASENWTPYYNCNGTGHSFLGIDYKDETQYYYGYYGKRDEAIDGSAGDIQIGIFRKKLSGFVRGELYNKHNETWDNYDEGYPIFTIAKTFPISESQLDKILEYKNDHGTDLYRIADNNCTSFAIKSLKYADVDLQVSEHFWTRDGLSNEWLANIYYGYSPADTCQDIRENYTNYLACRTYTLKDGTSIVAYELIQKGAGGR